MFGHKVSCPVKDKSYSLPFLIESFSLLLNRLFYKRYTPPGIVDYQKCIYFSRGGYLMETIFHLLIFLLPISINADSREEYEIEAHHLSERCVALKINTIDTFDITCTTVSTSKGIIIIDTGISESIGKAFRSEIENLLHEESISYITASHTHIDLKVYS